MASSNKNWQLYCKVSGISNPDEALQDFDNVPRYIRLRNTENAHHLLSSPSSLRQFQNFSCQRVPWLPQASNFFSIHHHHNTAEATSSEVSFKEIKSEIMSSSSSSSSEEVKNHHHNNNKNQPQSIVSMDASSYVALLALCPKKNDKVLDVCCAPGMKLISICDLLSAKDGGVVVGIDASLDRALVCRSLLSQHVSSSFANAEKSTWSFFGHCRLYLGDGTTFSASTAQGQIEEGLRNESTNPAKTARHQKYQLQKIKKQQDHHHKESGSRRQRDEEQEQTQEKEICNNSTCLWESEGCPVLWSSSTDYEDDDDKKTDENIFKFDRVLVDAECTHDGSVAHMDKFQQANFGDKSPNLFGTKTTDNGDGHQNDDDDDGEINICNQLSAKLEKLYHLQFSLLMNGYENCKENGGVIIYSTCSMSPKQNEEIVKRFLEHVNNNNNSEKKVDLVDPFEELERASGEYSENLRFSSSSDDDEASPMNRLRNEICVESKILPKTYSLHPRTSKTSVQFIAKFVKR